MQMTLVHGSGMMVLVEEVLVLLDMKQGTVLHHGVSWLLSLRLVFPQWQKVSGLSLFSRGGYLRGLDF